MFNKTIADYAGLDEPWAEMADDRVSAEPQLLPYYDLLIERGQIDQEDHWKWIATARLDEIVIWAAEIREDEADEPEEEPFKYERAVAVTITLYPGQLAAVDTLKACKRHRGKRSPAVQEIVDWYIACLGEEATP